MLTDGLSSAVNKHSIFFQNMAVIAAFADSLVTFEGRTCGSGGLVWVFFPLPLPGLVMLPCGNCWDTKDFKERTEWPMWRVLWEKQNAPALRQQCNVREMENKHKPECFVCFLLWQLSGGNIHSGNSSFSTVLGISTKFGVKKSIWDK